MTIFNPEPWRAVASARHQVTRSNEWVEGSMIEPSASYGNLYLDLTREFVAQYKNSPPPSDAEKNAFAATPTARPTIPPTLTPTARVTNAPSPTRTFTPTRGPSLTPTVTPIEFAAYRTTEILRVRSGPGTNFELLGKLPRGFVLDVLARSEDSKWLAIVYPDFGSLGWISAEFVTPQESLEQFPVEPALAQDGAAPTPAPSDDTLPIWY